MKYTVSTKDVIRFNRTLFKKIDVFDPSQVFIEDEDVDFFQELYSKLQGFHENFLETAVNPFINMLTLYTTRLRNLREMDEQCTTKFQRFREKKLIVYQLNKRKAGIKSKKGMKAMEKLQDAESDYNIAELDFVKAVKNTQSDLAFEYLLLVCKFTQEMNSRLRKGHSLLGTTNKIVKEFEEIVKAKMEEQIKIRKANDLKISQVRDLNENDSDVMKNEAFMVAINKLCPPDTPPLYFGEKLLVDQKHVMYIHNHHFCAGVLFITNFRMIFLPYISKAKKEEFGPKPWLKFSCKSQNGSQDFTRRSEIKPWFAVANAMIASVNFMGKYLMTVVGKDLTSHLLSFRHASVKASLFRKTVMPIVWGSYAEGKEKQTPPANAYFLAAPKPILSSCIYDIVNPLKDYSRLKMDGSKGSEWRIFENKNFEISPTYPSKVIVPREASDELIRSVAKFRRKRRFPAAVWCRRYNQATIVKHVSTQTYIRRKSTTRKGLPSIFRCSQPKPGLSWARSKADEYLLELLGHSSKSDNSRITRSRTEDIKQHQSFSSTIESTSVDSDLHNSSRITKSKTKAHVSNLYVFDCRPKANAIANLAKGGGWESRKYYKNCIVEFFNIENIHIVRDSFKELKSLFMNLPLKSRGNLENESDDASNLNEKVSSPVSARRILRQQEFNMSQSIRYANVYNALHSGQASWFTHLSTILNGANRIVQSIIIDSKSVVLHCSDGWDRTPQVCGLAELQLDPFYRTTLGFAMLITKEWTVFGHKFARRLGHGEKRKKHEDSQRSPVFIQWLDCVFQLLHQFPHAFEFNENYLVEIAEHAHSCIYGDFLCNTEEERSKEEVKTKTLSMWGILSRKEYFRNSKYKPCVGDTETLLSSSDPNKLRLFLEFYKRWDEISRPKTLEDPKSNMTQPKIDSKSNENESRTFDKKQTITSPSISTRKYSVCRDKVRSEWTLSKDRKGTPKNMFMPSARVNKKNISGDMDKKDIMMKIRDIEMVLQKMKRKVGQYSGEDSALHVVRYWLDKSFDEICNGNKVIQETTIKEKGEIKAFNDVTRRPSFFEGPMTHSLQSLFCKHAKKRQTNDSLKYGTSTYSQLSPPSMASGSRRSSPHANTQSASPIKENGPLEETSWKTSNLIKENNDIPSSTEGSPDTTCKKSIESNDKDVGIYNGLQADSVILRSPNLRRAESKKRRGSRTRAKSKSRNKSDPPLSVSSGGSSSSVRMVAVGKPIRSTSAERLVINKTSSFILRSSIQSRKCSPQSANILRGKSFLEVEAPTSPPSIISASTGSNESKVDGDFASSAPQQLMYNDE
eukprot:CAMPEP_0167759604 /NCGR_PEP_ID=MMETSP0110_2-20121227/11116_1 /TAXON_ID=629695 /ORGANISM="Gymnochlora sp., Strain CCMP2014" /LENGTH=1306 /DNA_ID=CAMNT_0007646009 /DNA_START=177 /DNA_END=4097 /DNA_ORIENTATION=+